MWQRETTSAAACTCTRSMPCSSFCPGLTHTICILLLSCFSSVTQSVMFESMFPFLLCCLQGLSWVTDNRIVLYRLPPKLNFENTMVLYQHPLGLDLHWEHGCETAKKYTCIFNFSQREFCYWIYGTTYEYIHTDTAWVQHVNVGLAQARPNQ